MLYQFMTNSIIFFGSCSGIRKVISFLSIHTVDNVSNSVQNIHYHISLFQQLSQFPMSQIVIELCDSSDALVDNNTVKHIAIYRLANQAFLLCKKGREQSQKFTVLIQRDQKYYCRFTRYVNLQYGNKLRKLLQNLDALGEANLKTERLALYQIDKYKPTKIKSLMVESPIYGGNILMRCQGGYRPRIISNCFKQDGKCFYFVDNEDSTYPQADLGEILDPNKAKIYGIVYIINRINFCLPFMQIISTRQTQLRIAPTIQASLQKTVYLQYQGNYCTGTLISQDRILTAKHLLSSLEPQLGSIVNVKIFPYHQSMKAKLMRYPVNFIDLMELQVLPLTGMSFAKELITERNCEYYQNFSEGQRVKLNQDINAIGFGKYGYKQFAFRLIDLLLPTVSKGYISKIISFAGQQIFFKTDANLYNGFSGCGIWSSNRQVGTAIFVIRNVTTSNSHNNHNVSFCTKFIGERFINKQVCQFSQEERILFKKFDEIQMRSRIKLFPKL